MVLRNDGSTQEAEDFAWEVFGKFEMEVRAGKFRFDGSLEGYFMRIAHYQWLKYLRDHKRKFSADFEQELSASFGDKQERDEDSKESRRWELLSTDPIVQEKVKVYYDSLGKHCYEINLYSAEGFSQGEIANKMNLSGGANQVKNEKNRCNDRMKEYPERKKDLEDYLDTFE